MLIPSVLAAIIVICAVVYKLKTASTSPVLRSVNLYKGTSSSPLHLRIASTLKELFAVALFFAVGLAALKTGGALAGAPQIVASLTIAIPPIA